MRERLQRVENHVKLLDSKNSGTNGGSRPTLRTRTEQGQTTTQSGQSGGQQTQPADPSDDPDRPTLHRRDDQDQNQ